MKSMTTLLTLAVFAVGMSSTASANHYRQLEDTAYEVLRDARSLRWEVRTTCGNLGNCSDLTRRADEVYAHTLHLQEVLLQELPFAAICDEIEHIQQALCDLDARLQRCSYGVAYQSPVHGSRYTYIGSHGTRHGIQWTIARMTSTLRVLHDLAHQFTGVGVSPLPNVPYVPYDVTPGQVQPQVIPQQGQPYYNSPGFNGPALPAPSVRNLTPPSNPALRIGGRNGFTVQFGR